MSNIDRTDPRILHAIRVISATYGVTVSVDEKKKNLIKFGRNNAVQNVEPGSTIMTLPDGVDNETMLSDNLITHFASDAVGDTDLDFVVEGHTISGGNLTFVSQTVTTDASDGRTKTALTTPLARVTRSYCAVRPTGNVSFATDVTFTAGVPTASGVHLIHPATRGNSQKASTSISATDFWIVTNFYGDILEKTSHWGDLRLEKKPVLQTDFNEIITRGITNGGVQHTFNPYEIIPANFDVRLVGVMSADNKAMSGGIQGFLASVVE